MVGVPTNIHLALSLSAYFTIKTNNIQLAENRFADLAHTQIIQNAVELFDLSILLHHRRRLPAAYGGDFTQHLDKEK